MAGRSVSLRFATRASALARQQTNSVILALQQAWPGLECSEIVISTRGDREITRSLPEIGGKGLFTLELEAEILAARVDAAVHSLKDLPVEDSQGLMIGAIPQRQEACDVLVSPEGYRLETLPKGARVGTSSPRRTAQLLHLRPDLIIQPLRGNVDTRLQKAREGQYEAIVLAAAGLIRLGLEAAITEWLPPEVMLPAPGQGALAVQCRSDHARVRGLLEAIEDPATRQCTQAERAFLSGLGSGCTLPVAAYTSPLEDDQLLLRGLVASPDGQQVIRVQGTGEEPLHLGAGLARQALEEGARKLMD
jgi:hydroxymethylbilane synthase